MTLPQLYAVLFWASLSLLVYTHIGYPALMFCLGRFAPRRAAQPPSIELPTVTVVLAVYNEVQRITARLQNLLYADYPKEKLDVVIVSDGSTDATVTKIQELNESRIQLIIQAQRWGKARCLNQALAGARGEIIVFADARQRFTPRTIARLVNRLQQPGIGAVSGALEVEPAASSVGGGIDLYWQIEKLLRFSEARWDSCIGCTGAVYAIRRNLFKNLAPDTLLDDVIIPLQIVMQGYRVVFEPEAIAHDPQTLDSGREIVRKRRTLAGNYQMLFRHWQWLLPWRNRLWWALISHKYLRLAAPFLMLAMFASSVMLFGQPLYRLLFFGQSLFYMVAVCGLMCSSWRTSLFSIPAGFVFLNWMALSGLWHYFRHPSRAVWEKA
jgi:cellulose synthase/poly-beta-1,6-N-acetylglucosamine synthase-like glycosyltransferase